MGRKSDNQFIKIKIGLLNLAPIILLKTVLLADTATPREHLSLDANWKFHLGDDWPDALVLMNSGTGGGPAAEKFSNSFWRSVNLPHDWAVELPFDLAADGKHGFHMLGVKHPGLVLQALNSYVHFATIYGVSPVGLPLPTILKNDHNPKWDDDFNKRLQEIAWDAVIHYSYSGVKVPAAARQ